MDAIFTSDDIVPLGLMCRNVFTTGSASERDSILVERAEDCRMNQ